MQLRYLQVVNFRGIASLKWRPNHSFCCLIGPGDSGKSTVLEAVEAALSPRWLAFSEADFLGGNTANPITVEATVGELSRELQSDDRFGLYIGGWTKDGALRDEPEDDDEAVITVRLTVDATLEPTWEVVCDRMSEPRTISNRDRTLFGLVRLAGDDARHLAWGQGSVLSRLTGDKEEAANRLAVAYRSARESAKLGDIPSLASAAKVAEVCAKQLGAYVEGAYSPGLELGRGGISSGAISLHDNQVPLRMAGLGTRRLATLAIQKSGIREGAIVLVDEIEQGLEPHRIIGAIAQLRADHATSKLQGQPVGQVLITTHSDVALGEAGSQGLFVAHTTRPARETTLCAPRFPDPINALLRFTPRALFARRILVCEGMTEVGLLLGLREHWPSHHESQPIEQRGSCIADGNGDQACNMALSLAGMGYCIALYRDSDKQLGQKEASSLANAGISVFEYGHGLNTEAAIIMAADDTQVQALLEHAREERGTETVNIQLARHIPALGSAGVALPFSSWAATSNLPGDALRRAIAEVAVGVATPPPSTKKTKPWFKDQRIARGLANLVWSIAKSSPSTPLATTISATEAWLYG